jgi:hypothetical protein
MFKRFLCILLSLMLAAGMTAALAEEPAAQAEEPAAAETEQSAEAGAAAETQEPVLLVTVNGEEIASNHEEVEYWINYYLYQLSGYGYDVSDPDMMSMVDSYALLNTIRFILIRQKAAELGLDSFTDAEKAEWEKAANENWEQAVASYMQNVTDESTDDEKAAARADAIAALLSDGYDEAGYVQDYIDSEISNQLVNRLMDEVSKGITVEDDEIQAYFNELVEEDKANYADDISNYEFITQYYQQPSYYMPEGYRGINHILLKVDDALLNTWKDLTARYEEQKAAEEAPEETIKPVDAEPETDNETEEPAGTPEPTAEPVTEEMIEAAKQAILDSVQPTVDEIKAKLKDGVSFDELILEYGNDPGMQDEKTRASGYPVHKDSIIWDPAFTAGAVALEKIGDVSEPVVGQYGVHILHYLRDIPGGAIELTDDMKNEIHDELLEQKRNAALNTAIDKWLEESDIVYTEAGEAWKVPEETAEAAAPEAEESAEATPAPAD